jgi:hypothetical protein
VTVSSSIGDEMARLRAMPGPAWTTGTGDPREPEYDDEEPDDYDTEPVGPHRPSVATAASAIDRHAGSRVDWSTFWDRDDTVSDWLCEPFLAKGRGHALYAPAKTGKSLLTLAVVAGLATGRPVLNQPAGPPVNVLYIDMEMTEDDLYERLDDLGYGPDDDLSHLHYYVLPSLFPLDGPVGGEEVVDMARVGDDRLVVIETTARATSGKENDADTLRAFYSYTGRPLKAEGRTLLRTDHAGKDAEKGQRGTSAKADDVDVVWRMSVRDGNQFRLDATHRRMNWVPAAVDLVQHADPLRYVTTTGTWPDGTAEIAKRLDLAHVPLDAGRPTAQRMLTEAGFEHGRTLVLAAAMRYRRTPNYMGTGAGNSANDDHGNSEAEQW